MRCFTGLAIIGAAALLSACGPKPGGNVRSFDAREVLNRLGPSIQMPDMR